VLERNSVSTDWGDAATASHRDLYLTPAEARPVRILAIACPLPQEPG
jgi:hypothetical protein